MRVIWIGDRCKLGFAERSRGIMVVMFERDSEARMDIDSDLASQLRSAVRCARDEERLIVCNCARFRWPAMCWRISKASGARRLSRALPARSTTCLPL